MILCSCNVLTDAALRAVAAKLRESDPSRPVTPGRVFQALGARPQCGGCVEMVRRSLLDWGFQMTCPEPLASIAGRRPEDERIEWDLV